MLTTDVKGTCAETVRQFTRASHEAAEQVMMPLIEKATTPQRYAALLQKFYGYYQPLEQLLRPFAAPLTVPGTFEKSTLLLHDLAQCGQQFNGLFCTYLPVVENNHQALGALYVMEGASLGGRIIARMLSAHNAIPEGALRFFEGHGTNTGPRWNGFVNFLNQQAQSPSEIALVCATAKHTFDTHARWMKTL